MRDFSFPESCLWTSGIHGSVLQPKMHINLLIFIYIIVSDLVDKNSTDLSGTIYWFLLHFLSHVGILYDSFSFRHVWLFCGKKKILNGSELFFLISPKWSTQRKHLISHFLKNHARQITIITRKSSCVNARGIPTATYQVLHLLTEVGYPPPSGYPPVQVWCGGTRDTPCRGTPHPDLMTSGGTPHQGIPHPGLMGGTWGTPTSGLMGGTPHWGTPHPGLMGGTPLTGPGSGTPPAWTWLGSPPPPPPGPNLGTPPPGVDWQTKWNYYLPSRTTYAVGNKTEQNICSLTFWNCSVSRCYQTSHLRIDIKLISDRLTKRSIFLTLGTFLPMRFRTSYSLIFWNGIGGLPMAYSSME